MAKSSRGNVSKGDDDPNTINGTDGADDLYGFGGDDKLYGGAGNDKLYGGLGADLLDGGSGNDLLYGHEGDDILLGGPGDDILAGQDGSDTVSGGDGNDTIGWGGYGHELISGGAGADIFYTGAYYWTEQQVGTVRITDFESGIDKLDLTRLDADERTAPGVIKGNNTPRNEAFTIVGSTDGVTPGHLVITTGVDADQNPITIVSGYTDTNPGADIVIILSGVKPDGSPIISPGDIWA